MIEVVVTTGAVRRENLQPNHHNQQSNSRFFTGRMLTNPVRAFCHCRRIWHATQDCIDNGSPKLKIPPVAHRADAEAGHLYSALHVCLDWLEF